MIREANLKDCSNLAALSLLVWLETYSADGIQTENSEFVLSAFSEKSFKKILGDDKYRLLVFTDRQFLRAYTLINLKSRFKNQEIGFEIEKLYVHRPFRGQGIGQSLLNEIKARYGNNFWLYTWVHNESIAFYGKYGFKDIGRYEFKLGKDTIENRVLAYGQI